MPTMNRTAIEYQNAGSIETVEIVEWSVALLTSRALLSSAMYPRL